MQPKHFVFPFLAHALGTLVGALTAHLIAASRRSVFAYVIGGLNLAGGIAASFMIPAPTWFIALDLLVAYLPMAWLASKLGRTLRKEQGREEPRNP
jgi:hydrogenase-4 membrane subunit HyfE